MARTLTMRVFAVATPHGYEVMPGGLARIAADGNIDIVSSQRGGGSKDVWVLSDPAAAPPQHVAAAPERHLPHDELPSQLVENLFWLGRYSERCEDKARLLRATLAVRTNAAIWQGVREQCLRYGVLGANADPVASVFDDALEFGLAADLGRLGWCATQSRSRLSAEHWRSISVMQRQFQRAGAGPADPLETLDRLLVALTALSGFALDDMTQDDGWRLLMLGRRLERIQFLAGLLAERLTGGATPSQSELEWLLDVGCLGITYRTRYVSAPELATVLQLLIFEPASPRALSFQWQAARATLAELAQSVGVSAEAPLEQSMARLNEIGAAAVQNAAEDGAQRLQLLAQALADVATAAASQSDRLALRHFSLIDVDFHTLAS